MNSSLSCANDVTPGSAHDAQPRECTDTQLLTTDSNSVQNKASVIPESVGAELLHNTLPGIGVFLSKTCMIRLVRCDFEHIQKTVELQQQEVLNQMQADTGEVSLTVNNPEVHTSNRKCTLINYKKFL